MFKAANWIWYDTISSPNSFGEFFSEFAKADKALLKISCDGDYTLFINGQYVSSGQYGDFEHYKSVDIIDITPYLTNNINKVAILVWHFGKDTQRYKKYAPGVICEITEGENILFATDENTLCRQSKAYVSGFEREISSQLGFSYAYDSTKEDLWQTGQGRDMKNAYPVSKNCTFVHRPNKRLCLGPFIKARKIGNNLYDLGQEYVGLLSFKINAKAGAKINIAYGECLENGHVKRIIGNRDFSVDYIAKKGDNTYTNYMLRFACRYIELTCDCELDICEIGLIPQYYHVIPKETFLKGIDAQIYEICLNTLRLSMMEHYVDCPWREQCLYAFDSRNQMLCGYYAFWGGNYEYAKSNLLLMGQDKRADGLMSICYPCGKDLTIPSFSLYYVLSVKEYIEHSGDTSIINQINRKLKEILLTFLDNMENGLVCKFQGENHWNFYDWSPHAEGALFKNEERTPEATISILTVLALESYKRICALCNLDFDFSQALKELKSSIKSAFFDTGSGLFHMNGNYTELLNALAIKAKIITGTEADLVCQELTKRSLIPCSLSMKCFVYDALMETNEEKYKDFILNDIRKTYAPMIDSGTVWETVEGASAFDNAGSLCHGWSSTPIYYYTKLM